MSTITTDYRPPSVDRSAALRAAEGVIAGYIHSLVQSAGKSSASRGEERGQPRRLAPGAEACGASRRDGMTARRRSALRRAPVPA